MSNYAKEGYRSKHNLNYWNNGEYFGFGAGAVGYINSVRYKYVSDLKQYCENMSSNSKKSLGFSETVGAFDYCEKLTLGSLAFENLMLGLRMTDGFPVSKVIDFLDNDDRIIFLDKVKSLKDLVLLDRGILKATSRGMDILNTLILDLYTWE